MSPAYEFVLVLRVPFRLASIHYRFYEESLAGESVFDWMTRRLRAITPSGGGLVCVCEADTERSRLVAASTTPDAIEILSLPSQSDGHLCRELMQRYQVCRLVMLEPIHVVAPNRILKNLLHMHRALHADLTTAAAPSYQRPVQVVEASFVDNLLGSPFGALSGGLMEAASHLKNAAIGRSSLVRDFLWTQIDVGTSLGIAPAQWPDKVTLDSARDVTVLRRAIENASTTDDNGIVDAWKSAAVIERQQHMTDGVSAVRRSRPHQPMRVLYASAEAGFTGAQQSLCHLIGALDRTRYEPIAVVAYSGTFSDELRQLDLQMVLPQASFGDGDLENVVWAKRLVDQCAPDIIHGNHGVGMPLSAVALTLGIPLVQHVRFQEPQRIRPQIYASSAVIAVSEFIRGCIAQLDFDMRKIEVIFNGVDITRFYPDRASKYKWRRQYGVSDDDIVVTMIARMSRNKRHDSVIRAMSALRGLLGRGHLVLVGGYDGDRVYCHEIRALIDQIGLAKHCTQLEFLADVRPILHASDIVTIPSENEPLSRAALEAMAVGVPVVVGDSGGTKELIDHGENGWVAKSGDVASLTTAFCQLAREPDMAEKMGRAASEKVRRSLTAAHCAARTMAVYDRVLRGDYVREAST